MRFITWVCISLLLALDPRSIARASSTASTGEGGSITIHALDPVTRKPIPDGLLKPGMQVLLEVHAFDANGKSIPCTPRFPAPTQGISGNQIRDIQPQADGTGLMTMGTGFGSAEVNATCDELPNVKAKMPVANNTLQAPSAFPPAAQEAAPSPETGGPSAAAAGRGSKAAGVLLGLGLAAGVVALAVGLAGETSPCTPPDLWCRSADVCCPSGTPIYCNAGSAAGGCYVDVFITGCTEKVFCTSEY